MDKEIPRPLFRNYRKPAIYIVVIILMVLLYTSSWLRFFIFSLREFEYIGAFGNGLFYSYGMTTPFAIAVFAVMAESMNPFLLAFLGATGAVVSNLLIFNAVSHKIGTKIRITDKIFFDASEMKSKLGGALTFIGGGLILMSPLPDEFAVVLLGIGKMEMHKFIVLVFLSKFLGVLGIAGFSAAL